MEEKLNELTKLESKLRKLEFKSYKLIDKLKSTDEFDSRYSTRIKWSEDGLEEFGNWFRSEITRQRKSIMRQIGKEKA